MEERKNHEELFLRIQSLGRIGSSNWSFGTVLGWIVLEEPETEFRLRLLSE